MARLSKSKKLDSTVVKRKATPEEVARFNAAIEREVKHMDTCRKLGIPNRVMHPYYNYSTSQQA